MNKNKRFEILVSLGMSAISAVLGFTSISKDLPSAITYFFGVMCMLFLAIIVINLYENKQ
jgi:hypothetical protein